MISLPVWAVPRTCDENVAEPSLASAGTLRNSFWPFFTALRLTASPLPSTTGSSESTVTLTDAWLVFTVTGPTGLPALCFCSSD